MRVFRNQEMKWLVNVVYTKVKMILLNQFCWKWLKWLELVITGLINKMYHQVKEVIYQIAPTLWNHYFHKLLNKTKYKILIIINLILLTKHLLQQELLEVVRWKIPVKILVIRNQNKQQLKKITKMIQEVLWANLEKEFHSTTQTQVIKSSQHQWQA